VKAELNHQFVKGLPYENGFVYIQLLLVLKMRKQKKSISLQQALAENLLSSSAHPLGSTSFPPTHSAINN